MIKVNDWDERKRMNAKLGQSTSLGESLKGLNVCYLNSQHCDDEDDGMKIKDTMFCWMLGQ